MKKVITLLLSLLMIVAVVSSLAIGSSAEEADIDVVVGQVFEWNIQNATVDAQRLWGKGNGKSPDGLWSYKFFALGKKIYGDMVYNLQFSCYTWSTSATETDGMGWARVRSFGGNFHPDTKADVVKSFVFPSGGTVTVQNLVRRTGEYIVGKNTPTSFAVYLDDVLVYPKSGAEYEALTSNEEVDISFDLEVKKGQRLYIHLGAIDGDRGSDGVDMSNFITYKSVNDEVETENSIATLEEFTILTNTVTLENLTDRVDNDAKPSNNAGNASSTDSGSSLGLILGIVGGVIVVIAVVVVIVIKKKKQ